jgi:hypothetical protein
MPLAWAVSADPHFVTLCFGAVLGGSVFGDQCSPISDTTILSSLGEDHAARGDCAAGESPCAVDARYRDGRPATDRLNSSIRPVTSIVLHIVRICMTRKRNDYIVSDGLLELEGTPADMRPFALRSSGATT